MLLIGVRVEVVLSVDFKNETSLRDVEVDKEHAFQTVLIYDERLVGVELT